MSRFFVGRCAAKMTSAYGWAFPNPVRRIYYNLTVTSLSVAVALIIGTIELLRVAANLGLEGGFASFMTSLDLSRLGYGHRRPVRHHLGWALQLFGRRKLRTTLE